MAFLSQLTASFVGASKRLTSRFSQTFTDVGTQVAPVFVIGQDRPDPERGMFGGGFEIAAAAGQRCTWVIEPTREIELVAAWVSRSAGAVDISVSTQPRGALAGAPAPISSLLIFGTDLGDPGADVFVTTQAFFFAPDVQFSAGANETLFVPVAGAVLKSGRALWLQVEAAGITARGGFLWRVLA